MPAKPGFDFNHFLRHASTAVGVYKMLGIGDQVLYVGKAKNLRSRLKNYQKKFNHDPKVTALLVHTLNIELFFTQNETEALLLEQNFIKSFKPKYNVLLKDDKSYPYLYLSPHSDYPYLIFKRRSNLEDNNKGKYFGPYPSSTIVKNSLHWIQKTFLLRSCEDYVFNNRSRPCLLYQIKRCSAPCVKYIKPQDYADDVKHARLFITGKNKQLTEILRRQMHDASENLNFEQAARHRDTLLQLQQLSNPQHATNKQNLDVDICIFSSSHKVCFYIMFVRNGKIMGDKHFFLKNSAYQQEAVFYSILAQFYLYNTSHFSQPQEIILNQKIDDSPLLVEAITTKHRYSPKIIHDVIGQRAKWLAMAQQNLDNLVETKISTTNKYHASFIELEQVLKLKKLPQRIECFDISHISGSYTVASCVAFDHQGKNTYFYRKFTIKTVTNDDYAAMREALMRHYSKLLEQDTVFPDLVLIDGGKGQLQQAIIIFQDLGITETDLLAISKGHGRRNGTETLHLVTDITDVNPRIVSLAIPLTSSGVLLQQIRDAAHRFAIQTHRKKRSKAMTKSQLEKIKGIGSKRSQVLLEYLGSYKTIADASIEDLIQVPGISEPLAKNIYDETND